MGIINGRGGRDDRAMALLEKDRDRLLGIVEESQRHDHQTIDRLFAILEHPRMAIAARDSVAVLDSEGKRIVFDDGENGHDEIDKSLADAVRNGSRVHSFGEVEALRLRVDGLIHRGRRLRVVHPEDPSRSISAHVVDPEFSSAPNVYVDAVAKRGYLNVDCGSIPPGW